MGKIHDYRLVLFCLTIMLYVLFTSMYSKLRFSRRF